jgi:hypothetical protein
MKKHLGSTIASIIGIITLIGGLAEQYKYVITGVVIILGAWAYKSAKKRYLGTVKSSKLRKTFEINAIFWTIILILLQKNLKQLIVTDPVPNLIIPLWVIIAYLIISFKKPKKIFIKLSSESSDIK